MKYPRIVACLLGLAASPVYAQPLPKPAPKNGTYAELKREYDGAMKKFLDEGAEAILEAKNALLDETKAAEIVLQNAKTNEEKTAARKQLQAVATMTATKMRRPDSPAAKFSRRFLEFGEKNLQDSSACESIVLALETSGGPSGKVGTWGPAVKCLQAHQVLNPEIKKAFRWLGRTLDVSAENLLREIIVRNPNRKIQALACRTLARGFDDAAQLTERFDGTPTMRAYVEATLGKERVVEMIANPDKAQKNAKELAIIFKEKYADLFPDLAIGKSAPEAVSQEVTGKGVTLSALRGKVVVLDIWATWCGPCRAMIPHERKMVDHLKGKPFALVSISVDEKKETLTDFLAKEKMPWTQWWDGRDGNIQLDWDITYFPTIYVLDAQGIIRHKDIRGEDLEAAVNELLKELERKSSN